MACNIRLELKNGLQILEMAGYLLFIFGGELLGLATAIYLLLYTHWRWLTILYLIWMWGFDRDTCDKGGRGFNWIRSWITWKYTKDYFALKLEKIDGVELDPKKNYLFCCFPHGIISTGPFLAFCGGLGDFNHLFPHHTPHLLTLKQNFMFPFVRDLGFAIGSCSVTAKSIDYLLNVPEGGHVAALMVGGAREACNCHPGQYKLFLKQRKGFVKLAMRKGAPLVPVISFGETDIYSQIPNPEGSIVRKLQEACMKKIGFAPVIPLGRAYTLLPMRRPITVLVGHPIDVPKTEEPTKKQIDALHEKFIKALTQLFEENKQRYIRNSEKVNLEIE